MSLICIAIVEMFVESDDALEKLPQAFLKGVPKLINSREKKMQKKEECKVDMFAHPRRM